MEEVKNLILELFQKKNTYIDIEQLRKLLNIKGEKQTEFFNEALNALIEDGSLFFNEKKGYILFTHDLGIAYGEVELNKQGNGFVHTKDGYTIFVEANDLNGALNKDLVYVNNIIPGRKKDYAGSICKIIKRNTGTAFYEVIGSGLTATLVPYNNNYNVNIEINKKQRKALIDGQIIEVEIGKEQEDGIYMASVIKEVGYKSDPDTDLSILAYECNIDSDFTVEELEQAQSMPIEVSNKDMEGRIDLRRKKFLTIDCDNTKDRDDAVCIEKLDNGNYKLYVSIASVNHYIKKGTPLYEGILRRCTSHYPNNTCMPMLPHSISNGICSLHAGVDRLTKTCEMEIDNKGNIIDSKVYNSVINSKCAMKYSLVNDVIDGKDVQEYKDFYREILEMQKLSLILSKCAENRKYLDFNIPEIEVKKVGDELKFNLSHQGNAEKIIENFMVITDNVVAKEYGWLPFIFRTHDLPKKDLVERVIQKINCAGLHINISSNIDAIEIKKVLNILGSKEEYQVFNQILLRSMQKARYSTNNIGHFALQLEDYCHFTSPIRRAADFMVHTVIDEAEEHNYDYNYLETLEKDLYEVAANATREEIKDKLFEEEARKMAMAEYMMNHIGEESPAIITEVYPHGAFVRTNDLIEGKVALEDFDKDNNKVKYKYNPNIDAIIGTNNHIYHIGDYVDVKSLNASKENRIVNFEIQRKRKKA